MKKSTQTTKRRMRGLTQEEKDFIAFSLDGHTALLDQHRSCPWMGSVEDQKKRAEAVKRALKERRRRGKKCELTEDDFLFVEFSLNERVDFLHEGVGDLWLSDANHDAMKSTMLIDKLRKLLNLPAVKDDDVAIDFF